MRIRCCKRTHRKEGNAHIEHIPTAAAAAALGISCEEEGDERETRERRESDERNTRERRERHERERCDDERESLERDDDQCACMCACVRGLYI